MTEPVVPGVAWTGRAAACVAALLIALTAARAPALLAGCAGDCDHNGTVSIAELITGVRIALGATDTTTCPAFDGDGSATVSIAELIAAVAAAAGGCAVDPPSLSDVTLPPGAMLTISHASIRAGRALGVTFAGSDGYEVVASTALTENGAAHIAVPPYLDLRTARFTAGDVTVSIAASPVAGVLHIEALPAVGVAPGVLTEILLDEAVNRLGFADEGADAFARDTGHDSATLRAGLRFASKFTVELANELHTTGRIALGTPSGDALLDGETLALLDRIIAAPILAAATRLDGGRTGAALSAPPTTREGWAEVVGQLKNQGIPGMQVLGSYVSVLTGVVGLVAAAIPGGQPLSGVAAAAAVASTGVVTLGSALVSIGADLTIDALRGRDPDLYQAGQNAQDVFIGGLRSIALTALGTVQWAGETLINLAGFANDLRDGATSLRDLSCATEEAPFGRLARGTANGLCAPPPTSTRTATATPGPPTATASRTVSPSRSPSPTHTAGAAFTVLFWSNPDGSTGTGAAGALLRLGGAPDFPIVTLSASLGGAQLVTVGANRGALLYGIVAGADPSGQLVPIAGPVRYGDYGIPTTLPLVDGPAPALQPGVEYVAVVTPAEFTGGTAAIVFRVGS